MEAIFLMKNRPLNSGNGSDLMRKPLNKKKSRRQIFATQQQILCLRDSDSTDSIPSSTRRNQRNSQRQFDRVQFSVRQCQEELGEGARGIRQNERGQVMISALESSASLSLDSFFSIKTSSTFTTKAERSSARPLPPVIRENSGSIQSLKSHQSRQRSLSATSMSSSMEPSVSQSSTTIPVAGVLAANGGTGDSPICCNGCKLGLEETSDSVVVSFGSSLWHVDW